MASMIVDWRPIEPRAVRRASPIVSQLLTPKYRKDMPTAIMTIRMAKPILEKRKTVSNSAPVHPNAPCSHNPKFAISPSKGEVAAMANIAVMGSKQIIVRKIAIPLPAITGFIERM